MRSVAVLGSINEGPANYTQEDLPMGGLTRSPWPSCNLTVRTDTEGPLHPANNILAFMRAG